ncbi:hypothetical protein AVEN_160166-1, partial [Araneus ventricosus]
MVPTVLCYLISTSSTIYSPGGQSSAPPIATWRGVPIFTPVPVFTPVPLSLEENHYSRGRKATRSSLITGSPYKDQLTKSLERSAPKKTSLSVPR